MLHAWPHHSSNQFIIKQTIQTNNNKMKIQRFSDRLFAVASNCSFKTSLNSFLAAFDVSNEELVKSTRIFKPISSKGFLSTFTTFFPDFFLSICRNGIRVLNTKKYNGTTLYSLLKRGKCVWNLRFLIFKTGCTFVTGGCTFVTHWNSEQIGHRPF